MLLIIIKSSELLPWISQTIINNALKLVKKTCFFFKNHFSVFGYLMKHSSL